MKTNLKTGICCSWAWPADSRLLFSFLLILKAKERKWQAKEISLENGRFGMVLARNVNNEAKERGALLSASGARGTIGDYD